MSETNEPLDLSKQRIIVTGGAGFLGSFVLEALRERGCREIFVPRKRNYDLCDRAAVNRMFDDFPADVVIHLAATVGGIGANQANPGKYFFENLVMGVELIHAAMQRGVRKFVTAGTICAYPKFTPVPFREDDLWNGYPEETNAPYGIAKKALLVQTQAYREQYGFPGIYLLPVNLYGPRDNFDLESSHVIPALIRKFVDARDSGRDRVELWGDGSPTREFIHARDAARGIVMAAERYDAPDPVNIGSGMEISIRALAQQIQSLVGYDGQVVFDTSRPNGQPRRCLDTSRAERAFGFRASIDLEDGLRETIA